MLSTTHATPSSSHSASTQVPGRRDSSCTIVEKAEIMETYEGHGTEDSPFVVRWSENEPDNPYNWSTPKRYMILVQLALSMLAVAVGSSIYGGASAGIQKELKAAPIIVVLGLSLYVVGFATGPLLWGPFSEEVGRKKVYMWVMGPFVAFNIGASFAPNIEALLICRFFAGFFGSGPLNNSPGNISDIFRAHERAKAMSAFGAAGFLGPCIGPIAGDLIGANLSWRWVLWIQAIFSAVAYVAGALVPETYGVFLLRQKANKLTLETGKNHLSEYDLFDDAKETMSHKLLMSTKRPFQLFFGESIVALFSMYTAVIYGIIYLFFGAFAIIFQETRGWSLGLSGLAFIGLGLGQVIGILANLWISQKYSRDAAANGGTLPPEARLPMACAGSVILPVGMFWFAWTVQPSVHWAVPIAASILVGLGMLLIFLGLVNYLVDAYVQYSASALAANAVLRSLAGAAFPLFTAQMFHKLGNNWALTLLSCLCLILAPIPFAFHRWGPQIRARSTFAPGHGKQTSLSKSVALDIEKGDLRQKEDLKQEEELIEVRTRHSVVGQ